MISSPETNNNNFFDCKLTDVSETIISELLKLLDDIEKTRQKQLDVIKQIKEYHN